MALTNNDIKEIRETMSPMGTIPFTQYLRPDGRKTRVYVKRPMPIAARAQLIIEKGHRFECEMLQTGDVSVTVFDLDKEEDVAIRICANGPEVLDAVDSIIEELTDVTN